MAKYNIIEKKEKVAAYRSLVSPKMMDEMQEKIMNIIVMQKKYRDKEYSAKKLAEELGLRVEKRLLSALILYLFWQTIWAMVTCRVMATSISRHQILIAWRLREPVSHKLMLEVVSVLHRVVR